jgi:predicted HTH domain antitoxin
MALSLTISNEVTDTIKLPKQQIKSQLIKEIAFTLYDRELTSMGVARRFAKMSKWEFIEELAKRGIARHYYTSEMEEDINYAADCE